MWAATNEPKAGSGVPNVGQRPVAVTTVEVAHEGHAVGRGERPAVVMSK